MVMKGCSAFPKTPVSVEPRHQIVSCHIEDTRWVGFLPFFREAVDVFYRPSQLGNLIYSLTKLRINCDNNDLLFLAKKFDCQYLIHKKVNTLFIRFCCLPRTSHSWKYKQFCLEKTLAILFITVFWYSKCKSSLLKTSQFVLFLTKQGVIFKWIVFFQFRFTITISLIWKK